MSWIKWLKTKPTPRYAWCNQAGYGVRQENPKAIPGSFGLLRFDSHNFRCDSLWKSFGHNRFIVPQETYGYQENILNPNTQKAIVPIQTDYSEITEKFKNQIHSIKALIQQNQIQKLVLARKKTIQTKNLINPLSLLEKLIHFFPKAHSFFYEPEPGIAFLGVSPEILYKRHGSLIKTEAQAGTRIRGRTKTENLQLKQELLESTKDHLEHQWVLEHILQTLKLICVDYGITSAKHVVQLPNLQHLKTQIAGHLKKEISDQDILQVLHPTPAVCGYPVLETKNYISQLESFDRGFYSGALGYISSDGQSSEFLVAIRCALVEHKKLHIFAGAGIIEDSQPLSEWQEIENKMDFWTNLI